VDCIQLTQKISGVDFREHGNEISGSIKSVRFGCLGDYQVPKKDYFIELTPVAGASSWRYIFGINRGKEPSGSSH
jgi:hypothetical protein